MTIFGPTCDRAFAIYKPVPTSSHPSAFLSTRCRGITQSARCVAGLYANVQRPHYDAKLFPHVHPYGTGSLKSEPGGCHMNKLCRNKAFALESWFRRSTQWAFFQNDNALKHKLFWNNRAKRKHGLAHGASDADRFSQMYGTIVPSNMPESTARWKRQTREPAAITDVRGLAVSLPSATSARWAPRAT